MVATVLLPGLLKDGGYGGAVVIQDDGMVASFTEACEAFSYHPKT